jgi:hypothetical protein
MNAPIFLTQLGDAPCRFSRRRKMQMRQLGDRMSQRIVHLSQRAVAAVHVGDDAPAKMCRGGGGECLDTIPGHEHDVRIEFCESTSQPRRRGAGVARERRKIVAGRLPRDGRIDLPPFFADQVDRPPVRGIEMHARDDQLQPQFRVRLDLAEHSLHQSEFRARPRDETNPPGPWFQI